MFGNRTLLKRQNPDVWILDIFCTPPFAGIKRRTKLNLGDAKQQPEYERDLQLRPQDRCTLVDERTAAPGVEGRQHDCPLLDGA